MTFNIRYHYTKHNAQLWRATMFCVSAALALMILFLIQQYNTSFMSSLVFKKNDLEPSDASFFERYPFNQIDYGNRTHGVEPLFKLEPSMKPVFLEEGDLEVSCKHDDSVTLACSYKGRVKTPRYYIEEITFENFRQDRLPFRFHWDRNVTINDPGNRHTFNKLAQYFFLFETLHSDEDTYSSIDDFVYYDAFNELYHKVEAYYSGAVYWRIVTTNIISVSLVVLFFFHVMLMVSNRLASQRVQPEDEGTNIDLDKETARNIAVAMHPPQTSGRTTIPRDIESDRNETQMAVKKFYHQLQIFSKAQGILMIFHLFAFVFLMLIISVADSLIISSFSEGLIGVADRSSVESQNKPLSQYLIGIIIIYSTYYMLLYRASLY
ncbi:BA75_03588T0 [Komagataella pastoris]|uniref:BA75_03588T0 n=1 Tax=Komagataella pastoris TaxID=4922 RepID=A0A1B2JGA0_PICPA|nr:BA75_03588T0 [Komagataella pastoris]